MKFKHLVRQLLWIVFTSRLEYKPYSPRSDVNGYIGWYELFGRPIAFLDRTGSIEFDW